MTNDNEEAFNNVKTLLGGMLNDRSVPRNIKRVAQKAIEEIEANHDSTGVISSNIVYMVNDLCQDANIPFHSRTTLFRVISLLENIKD